MRFYCSVLLVLMFSVQISSAQVVTTLAGNGTAGNTNGVGAAATFNIPYGAASDGAGNLFTVDYGNGRIRQVVIASATVTTIAGSATGYANGVGAAAQFSSPTGLAADGAGNVYVADLGNHRIRKVVVASGTVTAFAGNGTPAFLDATGTAARFNSPTSVYYDGAGNLYIGDSGNHRIRKIVIATGVVTTLAGSTSGFTNATGTSAQFNTPTGIAGDGTNLYVVDRMNHSIRKIVIATGVVSTLAGNGSAGFADGTGTGAQFNLPNGITCDGAGTVYVADESNNRIRKILLATGAVTTIAGSTAGFTNGSGGVAQFSSPTSVVAVGVGNLYLTDAANNRIRAIDLAPTAVYSGTTFPEAVANNGTITQTRDITLSGDTWLPAGTFADGTDFTATGVPTGLTCVINRISSTIARISFTGTAAAHANANDASVTLTFMNAAFTSNNAAGVANLSPALTLDFNDPASAAFSGTTFPEAVANNGSITQTQDITLTGDAWLPAGAFTSGTHFTATGVPMGLTCAVNRISATVARISFSGTAATHADINDATVTLNFTNAAVASGNAPAIISLNPALLTLDFIDPPPPPTITSFMPASAAAGTTVTINGTNFTGATAVSFGGTAAASFTVVSATQITAIPDVAGASGSVSVTTPGGTVTQGGFTFLIPPVITNFTPTSAGNGGTVTINGTNFTGATAVSFGGTAATSFTVVSATQITAVVAAGASGMLAVTTPSGTGTSPGFVFIQPPTLTTFLPTSGFIGGTVTINGTNLTGATAVSFGGVPAASFTVVSATQITAVVGAGATGVVSVTTPGGTVTSMGMFTILGAPTITTFSPATATVLQEVTINGTTFIGVTGVFFGGTPAASFTIVSPTQVRAVVAFGSASGVVSLSTPGGTATRSGFTFIPPPPPPPPALATPTISNGLFTGFIGIPFSANFTVNGNPTPTLTASADSLPPGVVLTNTGLSGIPTGQGHFAFTVRAANSEGAATAMVYVNIGPAVPLITGLSTSVGTFGTKVTIKGFNLAGVNSVSFGGVAAQRFVFADGEIEAVVGAGGTGAVTVSTPLGSDTHGNFVFTLEQAPTLAGVPLPTVLTGDENFSVSLTGRNIPAFASFSLTPLSEIGAVAGVTLPLQASGITETSATLLVPVTARLAGVKRLTVRADRFSVSTTLTIDYTAPPLIEGLTISSTTASGEAFTTIAYGTGFFRNGLVRVFLNGEESLWSRGANATQVNIRIPAELNLRSGTVAVRLVNFDGQSTHATVRIIGRDAPLITGVTPRWTNGVLTFIVRGVAFSPRPQVFLGRRQITVLRASETELVVLVPADYSPPSLGTTSLIVENPDRQRYGFLIGAPLFLPPVSTATTEKNGSETASGSTTQKSLEANNGEAWGQLHLSPNPTGETLRIELTSFAEGVSMREARVQVVNARGEEVFSALLGDVAANVSKRLTVDVRTFPAGTYIVKYSGNGARAMKQFTVVR